MKETEIENNFETASKKEMLRIQKALITIGYYPYKVTSILKSGCVTIEARQYDKEHDDKLIVSDEEIL